MFASDAVEECDNPDGEKVCLVTQGESCSSLLFHNGLELALL
jgi:hypothetical protein